MLELELDWMFEPGTRKMGYLRFRKPSFFSRVWEPEATRHHTESVSVEYRLINNRVMIIVMQIYKALSIFPLKTLHGWEQYPRYLDYPSILNSYGDQSLLCGHMYIYTYVHVADMIYTYGDAHICSCISLFILYL